MAITKLKSGSVAEVDAMAALQERSRAKTMELLFCGALEKAREAA